MAVKLYDHQKLAVNQLRSGSILCGVTGSGKSLTALAYFFEKECGGKIEDENGEVCKMTNPKDLYIITTAQKRDTRDWEGECVNLMLSRVREISYCGVQVTVDSWNNIKKYKNVAGAFFIFDEQRVVGSGSWVKSFLKIVRANHWILLSATPGDTWMDYVPVFVANGFYKNKTEFIRRHVVYSYYTKFPKIERYIEEGRLLRLKREILVTMAYDKPTASHFSDVHVEYDAGLLRTITSERWNPYVNRPIRESGEFFYLMRKVVNSHPSRLDNIRKIADKHRKIIVFYNFDYELEILRQLHSVFGYEVAERNGHKHDPVPTSKDWIYLVQYISGSEAWNCITTNVIVFYSLNYSYRTMTQAAGRTDRMNTPFRNLYYYRMVSDSAIDRGIVRALKNKKDFNERSFTP